MDNSFSLVINEICSRHFKIDERNLYSRCRFDEVVVARHILWYVLHVDMKMSVGKISKEFFRSKRQVFSAISKVKSGINKQKFYKELYEGFIQKLKEANICM